MSDESLWRIAVTILIAVVGGLTGAITVLRKDLKEAEKALAALEVKAAETYATRTDAAALEKRLGERFDKMEKWVGDKLDKIFDRLDDKADR